MGTSVPRAGSARQLGQIVNGVQVKANAWRPFENTDDPALLGRKPAEVLGQLVAAQSRGAATTAGGKTGVVGADARSRAPVRVWREGRRVSAGRERRSRC